MDGQIGRILRRRDGGGIVFLTVRAAETNIQAAATATLDDLSELKHLPLGSIIRMWGSWGESKRGTPTLFLDRFSCELRAAVPLPNKFHGLAEERRHKRRTLDLLTAEKSFRTARINADIVRSLRRTLENAKYREFNTGILQSVFEGGLARPFETILNATGTPQYLSLTSELKLKRLIAAGFERVCEITQSFRNEGIGKFHSPEFTLLEAYAVDETLEGMVELVTSAARNASGIADQVVEEPERITFVDACTQHIDSSAPISLERLIELHPDRFNSGMSYFTWVMKALEVLIGPHLQQLTFVTHLPAGLSPFVKRSAQDPQVTERAFLFGKGLFIADLYVDEDDPKILEQELLEQARVQDMRVNEEYLDVVRMGIPPTAGIGLGVNRLQMYFLPDDMPQHIRETILFPLG
jgi:lysyl-tRNA synthetase class 2